MHDERLNEVIDFYPEGVIWSEQISPLMQHVLQHGAELTDSEKNDLKVFLSFLQDYNFLNNPAFSKPEQFSDEQ
jgi:hypothetical protein